MYRPVLYKVIKGLFIRGKSKIQYRLLQDQIVKDIVCGGCAKMKTLGQIRGSWRAV